MAQVMNMNDNKTITIRYTPVARTVVYDTLNHLISPTDASQILKTLNRTKISTQVPQKPKSGEVYVYRARIIGKSWRNDGYERCFRSNGTHYYPKFESTEVAKRNALFKILRHVAFDKTTNQKVRFRRVTYAELAHTEKDNPVVIVQYFGDPTVCGSSPPASPRRRKSLGNSIKSASVSRSGGARIQNRTRVPIRISHGFGSDSSEPIETSQCEVIVETSQHQMMELEQSDDSKSVPASFPSPLDEDLREASAQGDIDRVASLLTSGARVNSANSVNGWTALHWAAKRNHENIVSMLLGAGANPAAKCSAGKTPGDVCSSARLAKILATTASQSSSIVAVGQGDLTSASTSAGNANGATFVPNYLRNPEFPYARKTDRSPDGANGGGPSVVKVLGAAPRPLLEAKTAPQPLLLLARVAKSRDPDFIEVELPNRSYDELLELLCQELGQDPASVERIRKLPNVRLRNDGDVGRLQTGQQLELVLRTF